MKKNLKQRILEEMVTKYTIERRTSGTWWIMYDGNHLICEVYTKSDAERIRRLLSFDQ